MTVYSNDMKSYGHRTGIAKFLDMPRDKVRVVYMEGPQGYGRTAADDAGCEAAYLAKELEPPGSHSVDADEERLGHQGPAFVVKSAAGWMRNGNLVALRVPGAVRRLQPSLVQRAGHRADCAADGIAPRHPAKGGAAMPPTRCTPFRIGA